MEQIDSIGPKEAGALLERIRATDGVTGCVCLRTCNRVEFYISTADGRPLTDAVNSVLDGAGFGALKQFFHRLSGRETVLHLFRVASGLDSLIVGEDQILHQVKEAYEGGLTTGMSNHILDNLFRKAISVGKSVRELTGVNKGAVSIGTGAVALAERKLDGLAGRTILLLGAGTMGTTVARALAGKGAGAATVIVNRNRKRAEELAGQTGGKSGSLDALEEVLAWADLVFCATSSPHPLITRDALERARGKRRNDLLIIDISTPGNVGEGCAALPGVCIYNIDDLRLVAEENLKQRRREAARAELFVAEETGILVERMKAVMVEDFMRRLYTWAREIREKEVEEVLQRLGPLGEKEREVIVNLVNSLTNRLLAAPTLTVKSALREGDEELLRAAEKLFHLQR